jgi:UDP-glucose 4-epimerase
MKILITGGAGFIGSHLAEKLAAGNEITIIDNFSAGRKEFLQGVRCNIIKADMLDQTTINKAVSGMEEVWHYAADPRVKESYSDPIGNFRQDCLATVNVLEACRKAGVKKFVFASSSVAYGMAKVIPTPEDAPIRPISNYAAAKVASENYVMSYSNLYGIKGVILRYANIIGPRSTHGVTLDFYNKLKMNGKRMEILGDGTQTKSYLHVSDAVDASLLAARRAAGPWDVFNVGSEDQVTTKQIADIVASEMGLKGVKYDYTGGSIGWPGDVPLMLLSISKLKALGWKPKYSGAEAVRMTARELAKKK